MEEAFLIDFSECVYQQTEFHLLAAGIWPSLFHCHLAGMQCMNAPSAIMKHESKQHTQCFAFKLRRAKIDPHTKGLSLATMCGPVSVPKANDEINPAMLGCSK